MYKNNIIVFCILCLFVGTINWYFPNMIQKEEQQFIKQKELITTYTNLKQQYSKEALKKEQNRIKEFLTAFGIKYTIKQNKRLNKDILSMDLKKSNANKVVSYILNSNILFKDMQIKKIDNYNLSFSVSY